MKRTGLLIDSFSPLLSQRIDSEIERRMLIPALNTNYWWKKASMNWNPWICSNWLACVKFCEHDSVRREKALTQISSAMNAFADGYPDDGGCDEGPTYWDRAAASLYECASMMPNSQSLPASFLSSLKKMAAYCYATYIADAYIACGNVLIRTNVTIQLIHESLAETHYFSIALTMRVEIRTTLCTTHR